MAPGSPSLVIPVEKCVGFTALTERLKGDRGPESRALASDRPHLNPGKGFCYQKIRKGTPSRKKQLMFTVGWEFTALNLKLQELFLTQYFEKSKHFQVISSKNLGFLASLKKSNYVEILGIPTLLC